jgi:hypothetical protein
MVRWYRSTLANVRLVGSEMKPPPLPSKYEADEMTFWRARFVKWYKTANNSKLFHAITPLPGGKKIGLRRKFGLGKEHASSTVMKVTIPIWEMFWSRREELIASDQYFQLTDADRMVLTALVCRLDMGGAEAPARAIWRAFQLDPRIMDNSMIYLALSTRDDSLYQTIKPSLDACDDLSGLRREWCVELLMASASIGQTALVDWITQRITLTSEEAAKLAKVIELAAAGAGLIDPLDQVLEMLKKKIAECQ